MSEDNSPKARERERERERGEVLSQKQSLKLSDQIEVRYWFHTLFFPLKLPPDNLS